MWDPEVPLRGLDAFCRSKRDSISHTHRVKKALCRALSGFSQPDGPLMDSSEAEGNTKHEREGKEGRLLRTAAEERIKSMNYS